MNVIIIAPDNRVCVDGVWKTVLLDMPDITAVRFDGESGHVEHRPHNGDWKEPCSIDAAEFQARFGGVVDAWGEAVEVAPERHPAPQHQSIASPELENKIAQLEARLAVFDAISERVVLIEDALDHASRIATEKT
jgi:hypothetical protein